LEKKEFKGLVKKGKLDDTEFYYITEPKESEKAETWIREGSIIDVLIAPYLGEKMKIISSGYGLTLSQEQNESILTEKIKNEYIGKLIAPYIDKYIIVTIEQDQKVGKLTISNSEQTRDKTVNVLNVKNGN